MSTPEKEKKHRLRRILERVAMLLFVLFCVAAFYLVVILAEVPEEVEQTAQATQPAQTVLSPSSPQKITSAAEVGSLIEGFPAPVLSFAQSPDLSFVDGLANDLAYEGAFARVVTLRYETAYGQEVTVQSIYPADALTLLGQDGLSLGQNLTGALAGMTAVRMESDTKIRLHVRGQSALYAMTAPKMDEEVFSSLTKLAQLIQIEK